MKTAVYAAITLIILALLWNYRANQLAAAKNNNYEHIWFAAIKQTATNDSNGYTLADSVETPWKVNSDFTFIGDQGLEPYWDTLILLGSDKDLEHPLNFDKHVEDAYLVKLDAFEVPPLALSFFQFLHKVGLWRNPSGDARPDIDLGDIRADIGPTRESIEALFERPIEQKPMMVNFLKYYGVAQYPESGGEPYPNVSGATAYSRYGEVANKTVFSLGGEYILGGRIERVIHAANNGTTVGDWDEIAVMQYPSQTAILTMENSHPYRQALKHRNAGLERTVIISALEKN